ncbi:MAG: hypothetical protein R3C99_27045 [Pirellulaceae bacterium]
MRLVWYIHPAALASDVDLHGGRASGSDRDDRSLLVGGDVLLDSS